MPNQKWDANNQNDFLKPKKMGHLREIISRLQTSEVALLSEALAFSTLLSLIPFIAISLVFLKSFIGVETLASGVETFLLTFFRDTLGPESVTLAKKILKRLTNSSWTTTSALALFLTSFKLIMDIDRAVNYFWKTGYARNYFLRYVRSLFFFLAIPFLLAIYVAVRSGSVWFGIVTINAKAWDFLVIFFAMVVILKWIPAIKVKWGPVLIGSLTSTLGLLFANDGFIWLTRKVFNYSKLYGGLAALPLLCLGLLILWQIILFGVALSVSISRPNDRDI